MKIKSFTLTLIILTGALLMSTSCSSNNDYSNYKKPYFTIEFKAQRMGVEIRLNDIPVFNLANTGFMTLEVPVNQYVIAGDNEIKVITYPLFDDEDRQDDDYIEGTTLEISLYVREDAEPTESRKLINKVLIMPNNAYLKTASEPVAKSIPSGKELTFNVEKDSNVLDYPYTGNYKKQVVTKWIIDDIKSSLPRWQWQDGEQIQNNDDTFQSLLQSYAKLHSAFSKKDLAAVKLISQPRSKELAIAYYLSNADAGFDYSALGNDIDHPSIKLYDKLAVEDATLEIFGNGKLARITNGADTHPILFIDDETGQLYQHQFKWQKNKNNEWVLIR